MIDKKKKILQSEIIPIIVFFLVTFIWYHNNKWSVLMGDDLIAVTGFKELGFWGNLFNATDISTGKIRPIQKLILYIVYLIGGVDYKKYYVIARIFVIMAMWIVYRNAKLVGVKKINAIIISVILITCPFSAYGAWQYIGVCESFFLICIVIYAYYTYKYLYCDDIKEKNKYIVISAFWFTILIFSAERFMYLVAVQMLAILLDKKVKWKQKIYQWIIVILPIVIRSVLLHILGSSSLGTGRAGIWELLSTLVPYAIRGFVNMLGFSIGDAWHGGFELVQLSPFVLMISSIRIFIFVGALYDTMKRLFITGKIQFKEIVMWYVFSLTSLFSYALVASTHGEDRFLWIPYMFYLIALGRYIEQVVSVDIENIKFKCKKICVVGINLFAVIFIIASNFYYLEAKIHVHFRYSQEMAQTAIESIRNLDNSQNVQNVAFVNRNDYAWVFYGNSFVQFYVNKNANAYFYNSVEELNNDRGILGENTIVIYPDAEYPVPYGAKAYWINDFSEEEK